MLGIKNFSFKNYIQNIKYSTCGKFTKNGQVHYFSLRYSNCNVLRPIKLHFLQKQHAFCLIFLRFQFFKVGKFAAFSERLKAKKCLALGGFALFS